MRIPSSLSDESLYQRGRRRNDSDQSFRRLMRLVIALVLVIFVMRQAARTEFYEPFFGQPAESPQAAARGVGNDNARAKTQNLGRSAERPAAGNALPAGVEDEYLDDARRIVEALTTGQQRRWLAWLHAAQAQGVTERPVDSLQTAIEAVGSQDRQAWREALESYDPSGSLRPPERLHVLRYALESAAVDRVVDGSTWRSDDFDAFYLFLHEAETAEPSPIASGGGHPATKLSSPLTGAPRTGALPLLQQPEVYRGNPVSVAGKVARVEAVRPKQSEVAARFGVDDYWNLWLRPESGSQRPILAVVPEVPESLQALEGEQLITDGPRVLITGRFLKRFAYRSAAGADLAPVVIGSLATNAAADAGPADAPRGDAAGDDAAGRTNAEIVLWVVAAAVAIGVALAAIAMWRTSADARRLRRMRAPGNVPAGDWAEMSVRGEQGAATAGPANQPGPGLPLPEDAREPSPEPPPAGPPGEDEHRSP